MNIIELKTSIEYAQKANLLISPLTQFVVRHNGKIYRVPGCDLIGSKDGENMYFVLETGEEIDLNIVNKKPQFGHHYVGVGNNPSTS